MQRRPHWVCDRAIVELDSRARFEALKDPAGREALDALVTQIEQEGAKVKAPLDRRIVHRLRERLQLAWRFRIA